MRSTPVGIFLDTWNIAIELDLLGTRLGLGRERGVGKDSLVTRALIVDQWGAGAQEQAYLANKIHNLKESGKRWAMVQQAFGKVALLMVPTSLPRNILRPTNQLQPQGVALYITSDIISS